MKEDLKDILLMGLGAMAMTSDKAKELKEELKAKGNELYTSGKIKNEELKHNLEDKIKDHVTIVYENDSKEELAKKIKSMSKEEKKELMDLLNSDKAKKDE